MKRIILASLRLGEVTYTNENGGEFLGRRTPIVIRVTRGCSLSTPPSRWLADELTPLSSLALLWSYLRVLLASLMSSYFSKKMYEGNLHLYTKMKSVQSIDFLSSIGKTLVGQKWQEGISFTPFCPPRLLIFFDSNVSSFTFFILW